jgi:catechol 2,3-dioxygenase-like lactoylglutathione lyase family enzyme
LLIFAGKPRTFRGPFAQMEASKEAAAIMNNLKLEVVIIPVSDVDRAKAFYEKLGWRLDADIVHGNFRAIQFTPPHSGASIIFGKGITSGSSGPADLVLAVDDIDAARAELIVGGAKVSEVFHYAAGPLNNTGEKPRVPGRDPEGRSYFTFASFQDPDGNRWLLQQITTRLPGREWNDVAKTAELLRETEQRHGNYEKSHDKHNWWDWYAPYFNARQNGSTPDEATAAADRYMAEVHDIAVSQQ